MRFGITLGRLNPAWFVAAAQTADELGFESVWMSDHLVAPVRSQGSLHSGREVGLAPSTPLLDPAVLGAHIAALTTSVRIGTYVYLLGIRHPFVSARAFATMDVLSAGRVSLGVGSGWLASEWTASGIDPHERGARLDEAIDVCRRLWRDDVVEHDGPYFPFEPVGFEPKPYQRPIPIHVGGESTKALARAANMGDGWMGMAHTPESAAHTVEALRGRRADGPRSNDPLEVTVLGEVASLDDVERYEAAGVDRLIVTPWSRSSEVCDSLKAFADLVGIEAAS